jgi:hypothetical protein
VADLPPSAVPGSGEAFGDIVIGFAGPMGRVIGAETTLLLVSLRVSGGIRSFRNGGKSVCGLGVDSGFEI